MSAAFACELSLYRGRELTEPEYDAIVLENERYKTMRRALGILERGDNTARTLYAKLMKYTKRREVIEECVAECIRLGYIDERRQLLLIVEREANRSLRGRQYIIRKLTARGYRPTMIESVIDELVESGEIDFAANFERLSEKMGAEDEEARRALAYKNGYRTYELD